MRFPTRTLLTREKLRDRTGRRRGSVCTVVGLDRFIAASGRTPARARRHFSWLVMASRLLAREFDKPLFDGIKPAPPEYWKKAGLADELAELSHEAAKDHQLAQDRADRAYTRE